MKKNAIITGCNSGIGKETAIALAKNAYSIIMLVRESEKSRQALIDIKRESQSDDIDIVFVDLSSIESIKKACTEINKKYSSIHLLINNAGVYKRKEEVSADGFELSLAVNYYAAFLITDLLIHLLKKSDSPRIINLSSGIYKRGKILDQKNFIPSKFVGNKAYANSKLLIIYFTKELAKRESEIESFVINPGPVATSVFRDYPLWVKKIMHKMMPSVNDGALPIIKLALESPKVHTSGSFFKKDICIDINSDLDLTKSNVIWKKTSEILER